MFYMVNPSNLPKKSKRRNPELLIVNPYSLNDEGEKGENMGKRNRKRKNPMSLLRRHRRRNPDFKATAHEILGPDYSNVKTAALMAVGGGLALGIAQAALSKRVDTATNVGKGILALAAGLGGGIAAKWAGETIGNNSVGNFLRTAAIPGAMGAMVLGIWTLAQPHVDKVTDQVNQKLGLAGLGQLDLLRNEFGGYSPYGAWCDETKQNCGFGQAVNPPVGKADAESLYGMGGYEPLGDIYNEQRLGSFEAEKGLGAFVPEASDAAAIQLSQSMSDRAKWEAGRFPASVEALSPKAAPSLPEQAAAKAIAAGMSGYEFADSTGFQDSLYGRSLFDQ